MELPGIIVENEKLLEELKNFRFNSGIKLSSIYKFNDTKACRRIFKKMKKQFKL